MRTLLGITALLAVLAAAPAAGALPKGTVVLGPSADVVPSVLVDAAGAVHVAYGAGSGPYSLHYARRPAGARTFTDTVLPTGPNPHHPPQVQLLADPARGRLLLVSVDDYQALLYVSTDGGATWTAPVTIWDSFIRNGSFAVRPSDGALGFVPELTSVARWVVPASLAPQTRASTFVNLVDTTVVSDRVGSRLDMDLAYGPDDTLYIGFDTLDRGAFVHRTDQPGADRDVQVATGVTGVAGKTRTAGGARGVGVLVHDDFASYDVWFQAVAAASLGEPQKLTSSADHGTAVFPFLTTGAGGAFLAAWDTPDVGLVARISGDGGTTFGPRLTLIGKADVASTSPVAYEDIALGGPGDRLGAVAWYDGPSASMVLLPFDVAALTPVVDQPLAGRSVATLTFSRSHYFASFAGFRLPAATTCTPSPCIGTVQVFLGKNKKVPVVTRKGVRLVPGRATALPAVLPKAAILRGPVTTRGANRVVAARVTYEVGTKAGPVRFGRAAELRVPIAAIDSGALPGLGALLP